MMFALALGLLASVATAHTYNICWHNEPDGGSGTGTLSIYSTVWHGCGSVRYDLVPSVIIDGVAYPYTGTMQINSEMEFPVSNCLKSNPTTGEPWLDACKPPPAGLYPNSCILRVDIPNFQSGSYLFGTTATSYVEAPACPIISAGGATVNINMTTPCSSPRVDTDNDGVCDDLDQCPTDPNKNVPGDCGCGVCSCPANNAECGDIFTPVVPPAPPIIDCGRSIQYDADAIIPLPSFVSASQDNAGALTFEIQVPEHYMPGYFLAHSIRPFNVLPSSGTLDPVWTGERCDAQGTYHTITQSWNYYFSQNLLEYVPGTAPGAPDYFVGQFEFDGDVNVTDKHEGRPGAIGPFRKQTNNLPFRVKFDTTSVTNTATANNDLFISSPLFNAAMILEQFQLVTGVGENNATAGSARVFIETSINPGFKVQFPSITIPNLASVTITEITGPAPYEDRCNKFTDVELEDGTAVACFQYWEFIITAETSSPCDLSGTYSGTYNVDYNRMDMDDLVDISDQAALTYSFTLEKLCSIEIDDQSNALFSTLIFKDPDQALLETYEFFIGETVHFEVFITNPIAPFDAASLTSFTLLDGNGNVAIFPGGDASFAFSVNNATLDANGDATITGSFTLWDGVFDNVRDTWETYSFEAVSDVSYADSTTATVRHLLQANPAIKTNTVAQKELRLASPESEEEEEKDEESAGVQSQVSIALAVAFAALFC